MILREGACVGNGQGIRATSEDSFEKAYDQ